MNCGICDATVAGYLDCRPLNIPLALLLHAFFRASSFQYSIRRSISRNRSSTLRAPATSLSLSGASQCVHLTLNQRAVVHLYTVLSVGNTGVL